jgi:Glycosyl transferase family 2
MQITIAIPTRERAEFLAASLRTCVAVRDPKLEILVSDNASADETRAVVQSFADPRIRYVNTGRRVSQRQNFENAIAKASGDYVMIIGDDDAVLPGQFSRLRAILEARQPGALSWPSLFYHWPGPEKRGGGGRLRLQRRYLYGDVVARSSAAHLAALARLEGGREDMSPKLYHGVMSRRALEDLRAKTGQYLMSGQIDAYIAAAAPATLEAYDYVRHPFTILAMGPKSGGSSIAAQFRTGDANDTARRVAEEAEADPVVEPMRMPFPALGFYYLNGVEQARRVAVQERLDLDYAAYIGMIGGQLEKVAAPARTEGLALLEGLARDIGQEAAFAPQIAALTARLGALPEPKLVEAASHRLVSRWRQRFEALSMIEPRRIALDLKPRGLAAVDGAARIADDLIGMAPQGEAALAMDAGKRWRGALWRAATILAGRIP